MVSDANNETKRQKFPIGDVEYGQLVQAIRSLPTYSDIGREPSLLQMARNNADICTMLAIEGRLFYSSDADQNDLVTGQTSFANTTPSFLLDVPAGTIAIPLLVSLGQTGTVAGGDIQIIIEIDNVKRYASGGTAEKIFNPNTIPGRPPVQSVLYSGATASAGYGMRIMGKTVAPDVSPAEGVDTEYLWTPSGGPEILVGPASFLVYTYAGTTGPSWFWTVKWLEVPATRLGY